MSGREPIDQLLERGLEAAATGHAAEAQALLRQVLERDPRNAEAWYAMAWTMPTVRAFVWCLEQALTIDPDHADAAALLHQARTEPDRFAACWLDGDLRCLDESLGRVSAKVRDAERVVDEVDRRLAALEQEAGEDVPVAQGARGAGVPTDAEAATPQRAPEWEAREDRVERAAHTGDGYPEELNRELGLLWKSLVRQGRDLRRIERRVERIWDVISGAWAAPGWVRVGGRRVSIVAIVLIGLGLLLLILGAARAFPYLHSRRSLQMDTADARWQERPSLNKATATGEGGAVVALAGEGFVETAGPGSTASPAHREQPATEREGDVALGLTRELSPDKDSPGSLEGATPQLNAAPSPTPRPPATALPTPAATPVDTATPLPTPSPTPRPTATPAPPPPTRIVIPRLGLDAPVVPVSLDASEGQWQVPATAAAGWHEGSAGLGVPGNTVLNGHNTTRGEVFRDLYRLEIGDVISVYANDVAFSYAVSRMLILPEAGQPPEVRERNAEYLLPTDDERLTLVTCHPYGSVRNRLIIIARPM